MKKQTVLIILAIVAVVAAVVFWLGALKQVAPRLEGIEATKHEDLSRLQAGGGDPAEAAKSLKRMAFQNPDQAVGFARKLTGDNSAVLRAAAFEVAAGVQGDEWDTLVIQGLRDPEREVRVATLKGVRMQPTEKRREIVANHVLETKPAADEKLWSLLAVLSATPDAAERAAIEKRVVAALSEVEANGDAIMELYKSWPNRAELFPFAERIVKRADDTAQEFLPSVRYLGAYAPEKLATILSLSKWPDSRFFLSQLIDILKVSCPKNWSTLVAKIEAHHKLDEGIRKELEKASLATRCASK